jgi:alpha/beta superfamily hydrolase
MDGIAVLEPRTMAEAALSCFHFGTFIAFLLADCALRNVMIAEIVPKLQPISDNC